MELPCVKCKGRCCNFPVFSEKEFKVLRVLRPNLPAGASVVPISHAASYDSEANPAGASAFVIHLADGKCPYLSERGCTIYAFRPRVCRDYGVVPELPCEFLYPKEAEAKQLERMKRAK